MYKFCQFDFELSPSIGTAAPFWISAPQNLILAPKENGMLTCRVGGNPQPMVTWSVNGIPIESMSPTHKTTFCELLSKMFSFFSI